MLKALNMQLSEDMRFKKEYVAWLKSQLFEYSPKMNETIAEQFAYMLTNRLTFYKTIETQVPALPKFCLRVFGAGRIKGENRKF